MRVSYRLELDEYLECTQKFLGLRLLAISLVTGAVFGAVMGYVTRLQAPVEDICEYSHSFLRCGPGGPEGRLALVCIFAFGLPFFFLFRSRMRKALKGQYLSSPLLQEQQELFWSDDGIEVSSRSASVRYQWSDLRRLSETKRMLIIDARPLPGIIMPKRAFLLPETLVDLKQRLRDKGVRVRDGG
ncbi:YcxB family protein [Lacibacterium aquatile]|uniref:YcxB family protein n=1 Tax=Lacibacterium aquatile TaxID=1168082 RepID=A0ABW5DMY8_9PROT